MNNSGIILTLAYPETIVTVAKEWYSPFLSYVGVGKKNYLRAGHAALVLINKNTGVLEYHDFGRYITPEPKARVRGRDTDSELEFPIKAQIRGSQIQNLNEILEFLATNPKLTHGDGKLIASVCDQVDYDLARSFIDIMQNQNFIRYAAFIKNASNCARFVTNTLIASVTNSSLRRQLSRSKWFTPSTIGNVVISSMGRTVFEVSPVGQISEYRSTVGKDNRRYFLDRLKDHEPSFIGTLLPQHHDHIDVRAQWLPGIAAGAWFELRPTSNIMEYWFKRISADGHVHVHDIFKVVDVGFVYEQDFEFLHHSNCKNVHIKQNDVIFEFIRVGIS